MKKQFISTIILVGALALAQQGFSETQEVTDGGDIGTTDVLENVSLSPGVTLQYSPDTAGNGTSYAMASKNDQGPMAYAVEAGNTAVYQNDVGTDAGLADWAVEDDGTTTNSTLEDNYADYEKMGQ
ncbi:MAG: hypothetical protein ACLFV2_01480 [Desulfurivibrionaceae bacterium]